MASLLFRSHTKTKDFNVNYSRMPSFCTAFIGALVTTGGVIVTVLVYTADDKDKDSDTKRLVGFILLGIGVPILLIGVVWYCVAYRKWKRNRARKRQLRKEARLKRKRENNAYVVDNHGQDATGSSHYQNEADYVEGAYPSDGQSVSYIQGQYPENYTSDINWYYR